MRLFSSILNRSEISSLVDELTAISRSDGFFKYGTGDKRFENTGATSGSEGHIRAREIGRRLDQIGGQGLMRKAVASINIRSGRELGMELEHAWHGIGRWQA